MRIAVLGLGEAGRIYAGDLAQQGAVVVAADPAAASAPGGVTLAASVTDAVRRADVVLSLVGARAAASVLDEALSVMDAATLFADMNTGSPEAKRDLAALAEGRCTPFIDVAILGPVPRARTQTPLLLSGSGAESLKLRFDDLDLPATSVGEQAGLAASLKLLRSVFMKGLAGIVLESLTAADSIGARDWVQQEIITELGPTGEQLVQRLIEGTRTHAVRREAEMRDALAYLRSLESPSWMTEGTIEWLRETGARRTPPTRSGSDVPSVDS